MAHRKYGHNMENGGVNLHTIAWKIATAMPW